MNAMSLQRFRRVGLAAALLVLSFGCVGNEPPMTSGTLLVSIGPPPPRREYRPRAPGRDFIWIEGYYRWTSAEYDWVPGHWEQRPHRKAHWKQGRWHHTDRGWYWEEGHWR
jgi:YXWGXW repeat-containing protein